MYSLTDEQIDFVDNDITKRGIVTKDVRDNILDHVCCIIENEMPLDGDFLSFYEHTIARFYAKELREIEVETQDLLTFKYYYAMKRTLKITAGITSALIITGGFFKFQHWPGAGILLFSGIILFSLVFLPLNIIMKFREDKVKESRLLMVLGFVLTIFGSLGVLFKVMQFPFANVLFYGSFVAFFILFIPAYFFTNFRMPENKFNVVIHTTFMIAGCGMLFLLFYLHGSKHVEDSIYSIESFQVENLTNLENQNDVISKNTLLLKDVDLQKLQSATEMLTSRLSAIRVNLIAKSNGVSNVEALKLSSSDLKDPNDTKVIKEHFEKSVDEFSHQELVKSINAYNAEIVALNAPNALRQIPIDKLIMTNTMISVVLQELLDIQEIVLTNENSFLNSKQSLLSQVDMIEN